jgi:voltage-gated potassium channel Kch
MMKAREPINRSSFGPDALKAIGRAFDESWVSLAGNFADDQVERARLRLADALLSIANDDSRDVETLKKMALDRMHGLG